jgi:hypothetical protein
MTPTTKPSATGPRQTDLGGVGQGDSKQQADDINKNFDDQTPPGHEDSALESIGKAITEPMRDAADEDSDEKKTEG